MAISVSSVTGIAMSVSSVSSGSCGTAWRAVSEKTVCPAADDDQLRKPGIERFNQLGQAIKIRIMGSVSDGLTL